MGPALASLSNDGALPSESLVSLCPLFSSCDLDNLYLFGSASTRLSVRPATKRTWRQSTYSPAVCVGDDSIVARLRR